MLLFCQKRQNRNRKIEKKIEKVGRSMGYAQVRSVFIY